MKKPKFAPSAWFQAGISTGKKSSQVSLDKLMDFKLWAATIFCSFWTCFLLRNYAARRAGVEPPASRTRASLTRLVNNGSGDFPHRKHHVMMGLWNWGFQVGILSSRPFIFHWTSRLENRWTKHSSCSKPLFVEDSFGGLIILPNNYVDMYQVVPGTAWAEVSKIGHGYRNQFAYRNSWWIGKKWIEMKWHAWNEWIEILWI